MKSFLKGMAAVAVVFGLASAVSGQGNTPPNPFALLKRANTWTALQTFNGGISVVGSVFKLADGTAGAPSLTFINDTTSGLFRLTSGNIGFSRVGTVVGWLDSLNPQYAFILGATKTLGWSTSDAGNATADIQCYRTGAKSLQCDADGVSGPLTIFNVKGPLTVSGNISASQFVASGSTSILDNNTGTRIYLGFADGVVQFKNNAGTSGVGWNVTTDATAWLQTRAGADTAVLKANSLVGTGNLVVGAGASVHTSSANKLHQFDDSASATGAELNVGTPTLGTCTGGTLVSGSHNFGGEITGNTSGSCILNFGTPNFTNTPFCSLNDETNLVAARVSARSASSITITGLTSGDAVQYICLGRIGT